MIPKSVDCIVVGTGLVNSILAAACSRIGKSVLHIDKNGYYGDESASFTFHQLVDWIKENFPEDESLTNIPEEVSNKTRLFCIDLCPRLLYSNGPMVELLVKSNVSRYHEFKNNIRILSIIDEELHVMPCQRSDVFTSPLLSDLIDKRKLMKFIELCIKYDPQNGDQPTEITENANKPIAEFLKERGLKKTLQEYIINSIAMVDPKDNTEKACKRIKNFMVAVERYGKSPFMFPMYGCGEFPQSFCRLSAVFGGVYCLNTEIDDIKISDNFIVTFSNKKYEVASDQLVIDYKSAKASGISNIPVVYDEVSRAILITKNSLVKNDDKLVSFLRIPPSDRNENVVYLLELNSSLMVCPPEMNIVYLWTKSQSSDAKSNLSPTIDRLYSEERQKDIMWTFFYQQMNQSSDSSSNENPRLHITIPTCNNIDYEASIIEAEKIFKNMCPNEVFLPRAPDSDEIDTSYDSP